MDTCARCGGLLTAEQRFCPRCGQDRLQPVAQSSEQPAQAAPPAPPAPPVYPAAPSQPPQPGYPTAPPVYAAPPSQPLQPPYPTAPGQPPMYPAAPQPFPPPYAPPSQPIPPGYPYGQPAPYSQPLPPYPYGQPGAPIPPSVPFYPPQPGMPAPYSQPWAPPAAPARVGPDLLDSLFGPSPAPASVSPRNAVQRRFRESLPQYATNPIAGAIVGAVVAVAVCVLVNLLIILVLDAFSHGQASAALNQFTGLGVFDLIAIEHHVDLASSVSGSTATVTFPIITLIIIPAISLALGGYIATSTDYSNQLRFVLARAAAIAPVYAVLMAILGAAFGTLNVSTNFSTASFGPSVPSMLLYGLVLGSLFALIGGLIKLFGRRWRAGAVAYLLSRPRGVITAGVTGALAAVACGVLLSAALFVYVVGASDVQSRLPDALGTPATPEAAALLLYAVVALPFAITAFAFSSGATASAQVPTFGYSGTSQTQGTEISLFNLPPNTQYVLLTLLIPIIAYFVGGRVAARVLGASNQQQALQAGALVGGVSSLVMLILAALSSFSFGGDASILGLFGLQIGVNIGGAFLGALIFGCLFGIAGAVLYQHPGPALQRGAGGGGWRNLGIVLCVVFGGVVLGVTLAGSSLLANVDFDTLNRWVPIIGGAMLGIPALCFALAALRGLLAVQPSDEVLAQAVAPPSRASTPGIVLQPVGVPAASPPPTPPSEYPSAQ